MTKKTNSLVFRLGLTSLWYNFCKEVNIYKFHLDFIIIKEAKYKNLSIFNINYALNLVNIILYSNNDKNNLEKLIFLYFNYICDIYKVVEKFALSEKIVIKIIKTKKVNLNYLNNLNIFWYLYIKYFYLKYLFFISSINKIAYKINNYLVFFKKIVFFNLNFLRFNNNLLKSNLKFKLRKILGLVELNIFSIKLENIIWLIANIFFIVIITNLFLWSGIYIFSTYKNKIFKKLFYILLISINYKWIQNTCNYISSYLKFQTSHTKFLNLFINYVEVLFFKKFFSFFGLQLRVNGKLNFKTRKSKYHYQLGIVKLQKLKIGINYAESLCYTKFGVIGIKTWLLYFVN